MRGGAEVLRRTFGRLAAHQLDRDADRFVVEALMAAAPGPCGLLMQAGHDAGLDHVDAVDRASTCFLAFAAFNLSDDLSDGDCTYLPPGQAPTIVLILESLFTLALCELQLSSEAQAQVMRDRLAAEAAQVLEVSTSSWTATQLRRVTEGIAGRQWAAYLRIMWTGTPLEHLATTVALEFGRVGLLADDIRSEDPRFFTLSAADRMAVLEEALDGVSALESVGVPVAQAIAAEFLPTIAGKLAKVSASLDADKSDADDVASAEA